MLHRTTLRTGHTLVELLVTLGTAALLAVAAGPSFAAWLLDLRRDATVSSSLHAIHAARQLAAIRGEDVSLCGSRAGLACSGLTDWSGGLLIATDGSLAQRSLPLGGNARLRSNRTEIRFAAGSGHASPATLTICDRRGPAAARAVIVSRSGRPRATAAGEGVSAC
ncbi:MAG TPA: GspH/FimT family pseudopilin [Steroidobacteraceae bacterium]|nr:GspH/FimT family pseudopilin [Steroidobacteraceae bacterium]